MPHLHTKVSLVKAQSKKVALACLLKRCIQCLVCWVSFSKADAAGIEAGHKGLVGMFLRAVTAVANTPFVRHAWKTSKRY